MNTSEQPSLFDDDNDYSPQKPLSFRDKLTQLRTTMGEKIHSLKDMPRTELKEKIVTFSKEKSLAAKEKITNSIKNKYNSLLNWTYKNVRPRKTQDAPVEK